jgi:HAD superfamily hydrolase (TIGR01509 family)
MTPRPVAAVVFDMDGTLIDSESVYHAAMADALVKLGLAPEKAFLHGLNGLPGPVVNGMIRARFGDDFPFETFRAHYLARREELVGAGIPLKPGAAEALRFVAGLGLPRALATSSQREAALGHLGRLDVLGHFDVVVTRDDVTRAKPFPDLFLTAAERLGVAPRDCLAVEDSHAGVRAALAAGMMTVMVPDVVPATDELRASCVAVHASLYELPRLFPA